MKWLTHKELAESNGQGSMAVEQQVRKKLIVVIGSTNTFDRAVEWTAELRKAGDDVLLMSGSPQTITDRLSTEDRRSFNNEVEYIRNMEIKACDEVVVVNTEGFDTSEVSHLVDVARNYGKTIRFVVEPTPPVVIDFGTFHVVVEERNDEKEARPCWVPDKNMMGYLTDKALRNMLSLADDVVGVAEVAEQDPVSIKWGHVDAAKKAYIDAVKPDEPYREGREWWAIGKGIEAAVEWDLKSTHSGFRQNSCPTMTIDDELVKSVKYTLRRQLFSRSTLENDGELCEVGINGEVLRLIAQDIALHLKNKWRGL